MLLLSLFHKWRNMNIYSTMLHGEQLKLGCWIVDLFISGSKCNRAPYNFDQALCSSTTRVYPFAFSCHVWSSVRRGLNTVSLYMRWHDKLTKPFLTLLFIFLEHHTKQMEQRLLLTQKPHFTRAQNKRQANEVLTATIICCSFFNL